MRFTDKSEIFVRAGDGGRGLVSFRSGPNAPKMGVDGGDGGDGGSVFLIGDLGCNTLSGIRYRTIYKAEHGQKGGPNGRTGRRGEDCIIKVPLGTIARDMETNRVIGEVTDAVTPLLIAKGGRHGLGNMRFLKPTHQQPEEFTPGTPGQEFSLELELKLIADVGLAGFPNAGKSTLLSVLSAAKPKIADYPFTTLTPQLGVVEVPGDSWQVSSFVMADIPGLIEGASEGKGLGLQFLKHLERTRVIAFVIDPVTNELDCASQYAALVRELELFSPQLAKKQRVIIISKQDACSEEIDTHDFERYCHEQDLGIVRVSSATRLGLDELKRTLFEITETCDEEPTTNHGRPDLSDYEMLTPTNELQ